MDTISRDTADQLTMALGEAVVRIWSDLPQDVQHHLFEEAITSKGETIRAQLAGFLHDKPRRTSDPSGKPREMIDPDRLGGEAPIAAFEKRGPASTDMLNRL